ncbi:hypothetical protein HZS55_16000 [Halosimplex rubrum]|uniref:Uncharacterized protein n=1 Tax=Halosimplex rubrum TaxID=869889 RepID=A0A7D5P6Q5_9EURY|nr:hypothetical protein [Halosimplex rubrum]QLH78698.1 hypothetical protein HZS55_16000 [Halosimplex rubrum]
MSGEPVVAVGLFIDAIGALAVVVPDFNQTFQYRIRSITPFARRYHRAMLSFYEKGGQTEDEEVLKKKLGTLWPILQEKQSNLSDIYFNEVERVYWDDEGMDLSTHTLLIVEGKEGEELLPVGLGHIGDSVQEYMEERYRFWGWILLASGFLIQLIGTLL